MDSLLTIIIIVALGVPLIIIGYQVGQNKDDIAELKKKIK